MKNRIKPISMMNRPIATYRGSKTFVGPFLYNDSSSSFDLYRLADFDLSNDEFNFFFELILSIVGLFPLSKYSSAFFSVKVLPTLILLRT